MTEHASLTDPDIHEPKNASTASANQVYVADGAGSGNWSKVGISSLNTSTVKSLNTVYFSGIIPDLSTTNSLALIPIPVAGTLIAVEYVLGAAVTTANATITILNPGVGTVATTTINYSGSALGTVVTAVLSTNNAVTANQYIQVKSNGGSTGTCPVYFVLTFSL